MQVNFSNRRIVFKYSVENNFCKFDNNNNKHGNHNNVISYLWEGLYGWHKNTKALWASVIDTMNFSQDSYPVSFFSYSIFKYRKPQAHSYRLWNGSKSLVASPYESEYFVWTQNIRRHLYLRILNSFME